jgi:hypothetical protein
MLWNDSSVTPSKALELILANRAPEKLYVEGDLYLHEFRQHIRSLPKALHVEGDLVLCDPGSFVYRAKDVVTSYEYEYYKDWAPALCPALEALPEDLYVSGNLSLFRCIYIRYLPKKLHVGGTLNLDDCVSLISLPNDLFVGGKICLTNLERLSPLLSPPRPLIPLGLFQSEYAHDEKAFVCVNPKTLTIGGIVHERNLEVRTALLAAFDVGRYMNSSDTEILDQDSSGEYTLLRLPARGDEDIVCLQVKCPSTRTVYTLRVPPQVRSCSQASEWNAESDNLEDLHFMAGT